MLKKLAVVCTLSILILAGSLQTALAQGPYNMADHFFMPPGGSKVMLDEGELDKYEYATTAGFLLEREYWWDEGMQEWEYELTAVWRETPTTLTYLGEVDDYGVWPVSPPMTIPANLPIGQTVSGVYQWVGESTYSRWEFTIVADGQTVSTQAGVFTNCLKIRSKIIFVEVSPQGISYGINISDLYCAANVGIVKEIWMGYYSLFPVWVGPFTIEIVQYSPAP